MNLRRIPTNLGLLMLVSCSVLVSCSADLQSSGPMDPNAPGNEDPGMGGGGNEIPGPEGAGGGTVVPPIEVPVEAGLVAPTLRRLTVEQYHNSLRELLGAEVPLPENLEPDTALSGLRSLGAATIAVSQVAAEQYETAARSVADWAFADPVRGQQITGCDPSADACLTSFVTTFGRKAWRRPLSPEEVERYASIARSANQQTGDVWSGPRFALSGLLQSPHFLYRNELGTPDPVMAGRRVLGNFELASRLSYFLWESTPDNALLDAAEAGQLDQAGLLAQAQRLLADPRASAAVETFFGEYLVLGRLATTEKLAEAYPDFTESLRAAMDQETRLTLRTLAFDEGQDFRSVFTSKETFVNAELAQLYGVPVPAGDGFERVTLPANDPRAGVLGHASFLAANAHASSSSATLRGKFVREFLLCQSIPAPPPNVNTELPDTSVAATAREKLSIHAEDPACAGCHALIDPIGLGFENFDGVGAYRETDNGATIDPSGELDGVPFADFAGLAQAISQHPDVPACLATVLFRHAWGQVEGEGEEPTITALTQSFQDSGYQVSNLWLSAVSAPLFRYVGALD